MLPAEQEDNFSNIVAVNFEIISFVIDTVWFWALHETTQAKIIIAL